MAGHRPLVSAANTAASSAPVVAKSLKKIRCRRGKQRRFRTGTRAGSIATESFSFFFPLRQHQSPSPLTNTSRPVESLCLYSCCAAAAAYWYHLAGTQCSRYIHTYNPPLLLRLPHTTTLQTLSLGLQVTYGPICRFASPLGAADLSKGTRPSLSLQTTIHKVRRRISTMVPAQSYSPFD